MEHFASHKLPGWTVQVILKKFENMLDAQQVLRRVQTVIPDLTQYATYYEGGTELGIELVLQKDFAEPQLIRSLFVHYEKSERQDHRINAVLQVFWSLLGHQGFGFEDFLAEAYARKAPEPFSSYKKEMPGFCISYSDHNSAETVRVDYSQ